MCECPADKINNPCARLRELEAALTLTESLLRWEREQTVKLKAQLAEARKLAPGGKQ